MTTRAMKAVAIAGGVFTGLLLSAIIGFFVIKSVTKDYGSVHNYYSAYDRQVVSFMRTNLEMLCDDAYSYDMQMTDNANDFTTFGQHLDKDGNIIFLGKKSSDFNIEDADLKSMDAIMLNKMIRKIYVNNTPQEIYQVDRESVADKNNLNVPKDYLASALTIYNLDDLPDNCSQEISNQLRYAIAGFVKVYLGLVNLEEVTITNISSSSSYCSFDLEVTPNDKFNFMYTLLPIEVDRIVVERIPSREDIGVE